AQRPKDEVPAFLHHQRPTRRGRPGFERGCQVPESAVACGDLLRKGDLPVNVRLLRAQSPRLVLDHVPGDGLEPTLKGFLGLTAELPDGLVRPEKRLLNQVFNSDPLLEQGPDLRTNPGRNDAGVAANELIEGSSIAELGRREELRGVQIPLHAWTLPVFKGAKARGILREFRRSSGEFDVAAHERWPRRRQLTA